MIHEIKGKLIGANGSIAIVISRFNESITRNLLIGATETLERCGVARENITVVWVPGAFEIPLVAKTLAKSGKYHAVICLGAIIKGATSHYDYVCGQAASGILQASLDTSVPVIFGILTTDTIEQAMERSGTKAGNKGADAAQCALEMANVMTELERKVGIEKAGKL